MLTARRILFVVAGLLIAFPTTGLAQPKGDVFDQFYRYAETKNRAIEPHLPGETVDHFTGNLRIVQEDLALPGKAGLDLLILRTYSSKIWGRSDLLALDPFIADKDPSPVGLGWTMHMGRIRHPNATGQQQACGGGDYPVYEAPDGSSRVFYPVTPTNMNDFISRDHWTFARNCPTATRPGACVISTSGQRFEFASAEQYFIGTTLVWPMTETRDLFDNKITVDYQNGRIDTVTDTWNRTVSFAYQSCAGRDCLQSITATGVGGTRQITYSYDIYTPAQTGGTDHFPLPSPGRAFLTSVQPPSGPPYTYAYGETRTVAENQYALKDMGYPYGGHTAYTYETRSFFTGGDMVPMPVVRTRTISGRALPTATWTYDYVAPQSADVQTTTITRPDAKADVYTFYGFGLAKRMNATGYVWNVGLQRSVSRGDGAEVETITWEKGAAVAQAVYSAPAYGASGCPFWTWDTSVQSPIVTKRVVVRGGSSYVIDLAGHDRYGQPITVTETGEAQRPSNRPKRVRTYAYDYDVATNQVVGRITSEQSCQGGTTDCVTNTRTYNGPNRRIDTETLRGVTTTFGYHPDGNLRVVTNPLNESLELRDYASGYGIPTELDFNGAFTYTRTAWWDGQLKSETNGRGNVTSYTYDAAGRIKTVTPPGNNDVTTYDYAPAGDSYTITRGSGATSDVVTTSLDGLGRVISTADTLADTQTQEYDGFGRVVFKSYPFKAGSPEVGEKFEFDSLGRLTATIRRFVATGHRPLTGQCADPAGCRISIAYGTNHCQTTTAARGTNDSTTTTSCFESFGDLSEERLVSVTDANGKVSRYSYNVLGNLRELRPSMPAGTRSFTYTPSTLFPKTETSGPRGTSTVVSHDAVGQPLSQQDSRNVVTTFEYDDPLSRLTHTKYGAGSSDDVTRTYDRDMLKTVSSANGGAYTYVYDELNRISSQSWTYQNQTYSTVYHYDAAGCLDELTYPSGTRLTMTCDRKGRASSVNRIGAATPGMPELIANNIAYDPRGRPTSMTYGNGRTVSVVIQNGRVTSISTPGVVGLTFTYDGANNIKGITDALVPANSVSNIIYDKLDRLFDVPTSAGTISYRYDDIGNRTQKIVPRSGTTTYVYDTRTNRLNSSSGPSAPPLMTLTWNDAGRVATSSDGAVYQYDGIGRRVLKQIAGTSFVYHYDVSGHLLAETLPSGATIREYYYVGDQLVAVDGCIATASTACNEREWYHTDVVGSVVARTDRAGNVTRLAYQPWGEPEGTTPTASGTRLFGGQPVDEATRLYNFGARLYSPELGRFASPDPIWHVRADPQSANLYSYTLNNPHKFTDPNGELPFLVVTGLVGAGIGAAVAVYQNWDTLSGTDLFVAGVQGAAVGGAIGLGLGAAAGVAFGGVGATGALGTGSAMASTTEVLSGGAAWGASILGLGKLAADNQTKFSSGNFQFWGREIGTKGNQLIVRGASIAKMGGEKVKASDVAAVANQLVQLARSRGATEIVFEGSFLNSRVAERMGSANLQLFTISVQPTVEAIVNLYLKGPGK